MRAPEISVITIVGSADTLKTVRQWLADGQPGQQPRGREIFSLRVEPIRSLPARTGGGARDAEQAAPAQDTTSLIDT